jgi:two-component system chemotaxis response regulator CheB
MAKRDIIVIGGSAGCHPALRQIFSDLAPDFPGSIFVTTHVPTASAGYLADVLSSVARLPVTRGSDGLPVERGHVYTAVPDRHLLLIDGIMRLGDGPRENMTRPAIDPLFRSAALAYGPRTVGVVLSGLLNDGASGLSAIKECGGTAVVQNPLDAPSDEMPLAALEATRVDEVVPADELGPLLTRIALSDAPNPVPPPPGLELEVEIAGGLRLGSQKLQQIADPSALSCPDCHGVLSEVRGEQPLRFRCQIGHAYTADVLASRYEEVGEAMRVALRIMEERVTLVRRMAQDARASNRDAVAELYEARAVEYSRYASVLREAALATHREAVSDQPDER